MEITVTPIDTSKPGSFGQQRKLARAAADFQRIGDLKDAQPEQVADAIDKLAALIALYAVVTEEDEGGEPTQRPVTVDDLDTLSFDQVVGLLGAISGANEEEGDGDGPSPLPSKSTRSTASSAVKEPVPSG